MTAKKKQEYRKRLFPAKESEYGPSDHTDNFVAGRKRKSNDAHSSTSYEMNVDNSVVQ